MEIKKSMSAIQFKNYILDPAIKKFNTNSEDLDCVVFAAWSLDAMVSHMIFDESIYSETMIENIERKRFNVEFKFVSAIEEFSSSMKHGVRKKANAKTFGSSSAEAIVFAFGDGAWGSNPYGKVFTQVGMRRLDGSVDNIVESVNSMKRWIDYCLMKKRMVLKVEYGSS
jgi:hypothetical protein